MAATDDLKTLSTLFPEYSQVDLDTIFRTRGKNFKNTCKFLVQKKSQQVEYEIKRGTESEQSQSREQKEVIQKVMRMSGFDHLAQKIAKQYGMNISKVTWEDCARSKNSCVGPCICDMTLEVSFDNARDKHKLPVIRYPNYEDLTWDLPMEKIFLMVGNETSDGELRRVSLKEYLDTVLTKRSLFCKEKDSHVLVSAQACMLPAAPGTEPTFNVALYSYQSFNSDPAVLTILASAQGSSAQTIGDSTEKLYFNKNGRKASFVGQRLKDNRKERGVALEGAMTKEEKEANVIMMIQVPLKQKIRFSAGYSGVAPSCGVTKSACMMMMNSTTSSYNSESSQKVYEFYDECDEYGDECCDMMLGDDDVEDVIVKVSDKDEGPFPSVTEKDLTRDERYPIRVTLQFYKATSNGSMDKKTMETISDQFQESQKDADFIGSLVTGHSVHRPTQHTASSGDRIVRQTRTTTTPPYHIKMPHWWNWNDLYSLYFRRFPEEMIRKSAEFIVLNSPRNFETMSEAEFERSSQFVQEVLVYHDTIIA